MYRHFGPIRKVIAAGAAHPTAALGPAVTKAWASLSNDG